MSSNDIDIIDKKIEKLIKDKYEYNLKVKTILLKKLMN